MLGLHGAPPAKTPPLPFISRFVGMFVCAEALAWARWSASDGIVLQTILCALGVTFLLAAWNAPEPSPRYRVPLQGLGMLGITAMIPVHQPAWCAAAGLGFLLISALLTHRHA